MQLHIPIHIQQCSHIQFSVKLKAVAVVNKNCRFKCMSITWLGNRNFPSPLTSIVKYSVMSSRSETRYLKLEDSVKQPGDNQFLLTLALCRKYTSFSVPLCRLRTHLMVHCSKQSQLAHELFHQCTNWRCNHQSNVTICTILTTVNFVTTVTLFFKAMSSRVLLSIKNSSNTPFQVMRNSIIHNC